MFSQSSQVINSNHGFSLKMLVTPTRHYSCKYSLVLSHFIPSCFNTTCCCANTTNQRSIGLSRRHTLSHKQIFHDTSSYSMPSSSKLWQLMLYEVLIFPRRGFLIGSATHKHLWVAERVRKPWLGKMQRFVKGV